MTIGFIAGSWDLFHAGHVFTLSACKEKCDSLIVGLHTDPTVERPEKNKPIQSTYERFIQLVGCKYVDQIITYDTERDLINILRMNKIDTRFIGSDYLGKKISGRDICEKLGIKICYIDREHGFSSSELRHRIFVKEKSKSDALWDNPPILDYKSAEAASNFGNAIIVNCQRIDMEPHTHNVLNKIGNCKYCNENSIICIGKCFHVA